MAAKRPRQRGVTTVELAVVCLLYFLLLFAVIEYARVLYVWNAAQEVARRAARGAATSDFSDAAALAQVRRAAVLRSDDGALALAPELGTDNLVIDYLWQDAAGALLPVTLLPACPLANRINCLNDPRGGSCIRFVRVRICASGTSCTPQAYRKLALNVPAPDRIPMATTVVPAESLGYVPGAASCP